MKKNQRREFLNRSLVGICGATFMPGTWKASLGEYGEKSGVPSLANRTLGKTGIKNLTLSDQELKDLKLADLKSEPGLCCHQCQKCTPQCPINAEEQTR
jgi:hypothetical protein